MNQFATSVRSAILDALPRLGPYIEETTGGALRICVPHPLIPSGLVIITDGDEISIGFRFWHTHGSLLDGESPNDHVQAALAFVERILDDDLQLVVSSVNGQFNDAWVTYDPLDEQQYARPDEQLVIGTWSGLAA